jgi:hypothetical protein
MPPTGVTAVMWRKVVWGLESGAERDRTIPFLFGGTAEGSEVDKRCNVPSLDGVAWPHSLTPISLFFFHLLFLQYLNVGKRGCAVRARARIKSESVRLAAWLA